MGIAKVMAFGLSQADDVGIGPRRILIVSDAWAPQFNGVDRTRFGPETIDNGVEAPLGRVAQPWSLKNGRAFSTAFHTSFPSNVALRALAAPGRRAARHEHARAAFNWHRVAAVFHRHCAELAT